MTTALRTLRTHPLEPTLRRFATLAALNPDEIGIVERLADTREEQQSGSELVTERVAVRAPRLIVSGWAVRQRLLPDGRRQIFSFLIPGDGVALSNRDRPTALASTVAMTRLETVDASALIAAASDRAAYPGLAAVLDVSSRVDEARLLDNITRLGRQTAYERVAHLLLELRDRLGVVGQADGQRFPLPATQEVLADALGLSVVHVNRILQQLRREKLIQYQSSRVTLLNSGVLASIADYRPTGP
ncbi:MAG: hypothetical protein B7Y99_02220 [Caulobacterales bacterium 32-69-10]|nr:MAG: hypothetical protein B7Y99_02220 [Caulobacterales bacterium 32-69-10]